MTDLGKLLEERDSLRMKHRRNPPDRFEVYRTGNGYAILQDIPGDGPCFVDGKEVEIVP